MKYKTELGFGKMRTLEKVVSAIKKNEEIIKKKFKVRGVGIFGSVVRGEETQKE